MKSLTSAIVIFSLLLMAGCVSEVTRPESPFKDDVIIYAFDETHSMEKFPPRFTIDPPFGQDRIDVPSGEQTTIYPIPDETTAGTYDPFGKYSAQTYYGDDNSVTRHYYLDQGMGMHFAALMGAQIGNLEELKASDPQKDPGGPVRDLQNKALGTIEIPPAAEGQAPTTKIVEGYLVLWPNYLVDNRTVKAGYNTHFANYNQGATRASDLLVVKATPDKLREIDGYLTSLQNEVPMIEIQVRVAELALNDSFQYGLSSLIEKITTGDPFLRLWQTTFHSPSYQIAGPEDFPGGLLTIGGDHDGLSLEATLEFLQRITDTEILAAPKITVLNGCRAVIATGDRTPVAKPVISGNQFAFTYEYKNTGITLIIVPHVLSGGMIQIQVTAEVSAVTGEETIDLGTGPIQLPIVSKRNLGSKLRVEDGKEFIIGGLFSYADIQVVSKVPLLGDIPLIGYLFKNQTQAKTKSEILFHITPRVIRGPRGLIEEDDR